MLADNCVPGGEVGHHCGLWDSLPLHLGALANVITNSGSGYQFNVRKDRLHDESLHWKSQVQLQQAFFVHFSAGQFRPKACGALSFEGEKLSFRSKNTSFFHKGSFFVIF